MAEHYVHVHLPVDGGVVTVMANLATTTSVYRETVAILTKTISILTDKLAAKDIRAKAKDAEIKCLFGGRAPAVTTADYEPTSVSLARPRMTINVGHMATRLEWLTQLPTAPINIRATRMK
jgi:hypothetical protein